MSSKYFSNEKFRVILFFDNIIDQFVTIVLAANSNHMHMLLTGVPPYDMINNVLPALP